MNIITNHAVLFVRYIYTCFHVLVCCTAGVEVVTMAGVAPAKTLHIISIVT